MQTAESSTKSLVAPQITEPVFLQSEAAYRDLGSGTLGELLVDARERRGLTRQEASSASNILLSYLEMMESGDYDAISDSLYLLLFFRQYAKFLSLDEAEITWRFMREFQAAENAAIEISDQKVRLLKTGPRRRMPLIAYGVAAVMTSLAIVALFIHRSSIAHVPATPPSGSAPASNERRGSESKRVSTTAPQVTQPLTPTAAPSAANDSQPRVERRGHWRQRWRHHHRFAARYQ